ncbi:hypothetical protein [Streptacidiphilus sp. EB129]|uniref:hypothetical protein n=1 Tax=Streptacidiphilus sp. EB129 TaxID=3156262 RepID=UPI0035172F24
MAPSLPPAAGQPPSPEPGRGQPDPSAAPTPSAATPAQWPGAVRRPASPEFEQSAKTWLFELAPARWWYEEVFHHDPAELAHMIRLRLESTVATMQASLRSAPALPQSYVRPGPLEQKLELYARERDWARAMLEQVRLVEDGLRALYGRTARKAAQRGVRARPIPAPRARPETG